MEYTPNELEAASFAKQYGALKESYSFPLNSYCVLLAEMYMSK